MDRLTKRLPGGGYAAEGRGEAELTEALGRFEDQYESIELELKLVKQNLQDLAGAGKARSATYATLAGSRFMLEDMLKRIEEPSEDVTRRLEALRRETEEEPGEQRPDGDSQKEE